MAARSHEPATEGGADGFPLATLVARTGVPASTIHHYRRAGLLPGPEVDGGGRVRYGEAHVRALRVIRSLRGQRQLPLAEIARVLPELLAAEQAESPAGADDASPTTSTASARVVDAAVELFLARGFADVTVSQIADRAGVAKGSVYRHFPSKEALFAAAVKTLVGNISASFAGAVAALGGPATVGGDRVKVAAVFAELMEPAMPLLLEIGLRAARDEPESLELALWMLQTLIDAAGRPLVQTGSVVEAGLWVIEAAFADTLRAALLPA